MGKTRKVLSCEWFLLSDHKYVVILSLVTVPSDLPMTYEYKTHAGYLSDTGPV